MVLKRALYVGRFQPFHLGHLAALKYILSNHSEAIIAIGSAQHSHTIDNPFTLGERIEMIFMTLKYEKLYDRVIITSVPDVEKHYLWVDLVIQNSPEFNVVYSNEFLTRLLFMERNFEVRNIPFFDRDRYEATKIRQLMANDKDWVELVPKPVSDYILSKKLDLRVKRIFNRNV